nr:hypothetical protein Iba_scaffold435788CG0010 [Ipomoea batatas]GME01047.1 hypothetical protein Iba_scaffold497483CG0010 [Ipomoea batatas]GME03595.1 hypothetical protein Iba_scaffold970CG0010 [Ipomoea batatas]GME18019.1 hypothetical protein Iba_scaffold19807CG0050 [Ipomoea batatas]
MVGWAIPAQFGSVCVQALVRRRREENNELNPGSAEAISGCPGVVAHEVQPYFEGCGGLSSVPLLPATHLRNSTPRGNVGSKLRPWVENGSWEEDGGLVGRERVSIIVGMGGAAAAMWPCGCGWATRVADRCGRSVAAGRRVRIGVGVWLVDAGCADRPSSCGGLVAGAQAWRGVAAVDDAGDGGPAGGRCELLRCEAAR